jgi:two-component system NtrC family sensor kinase
LRYPARLVANGGLAGRPYGLPDEQADGDKPAVGIEVSDTGHGIKPEMLPRIFEPMFTTKHMGTGAGLGLAICEQIIRQHGGAIQVESQLPRGTTFRITLPLDCRQKVDTTGAGAHLAAVRG